MNQLKLSILSLFVIFILSSCTHYIPLKQFIHDADVVKVFIYSGSVVPMVHYETNDIDKIKQWESYIDESANATGQCNYEGKLIFKASEDSTIMKFSLKTGCQQVTYTLHDNTYVKKLTPEGISFLEGLKKVE